MALRFERRASSPSGPERPAPSVRASAAPAAGPAASAFQPRAALLAATLAVSLAALLLVLGAWMAHDHLFGPRAGDAFGERARAAEAAEMLLSALRDAEAGQRGFLLTGDPAHLESYGAARPRIEANLALLASTPFAGPELAGRLRALAADRMGELDESIELRRSGRAEAALDAARSDRGRRTMDAMRAGVDTVRAEARAAAAAAREASARDWKAVLGLAGAACALLGGAALTQARARRAVAAGFARMDRFARALGLVPGMLRDPDGRITHWTRGAERLYGFRAKEALGRNSHELLRTRFPRPLPEIEAALRRDGEWQGELAHRRRDGAEVVVAEHIALHRGAPGEPEAVVEVGADVTALRRAEEALRQRDAMLRLALDASNTGTWRWEVDGGRRELELDARCKALFGLPPDAAVDYGAWAGAVAPEDRAGAEAAVARALDPADPRDDYACEYRAARPDGGAPLLSAAGRAFFEPDPAAPAGRRAVRVLGTVSDVTELRRAEQERRQAGALLRAIGEATPDLLYAKDRRSRMLYANPALLELVGKAAEEVLGRSDAEWHGDPAEAAAILAVDRRVMEGGRPEVAEEPFTAPGGPTRVFLSTKAPLRDAAGAVVGMVGVSRDITARKRAEQRRELLLRELDHRVKNTLAIVQSIAAQTLGGGGSDGARREAFEDRLIALAHAHDLLTREHWGGVDLRDLAEHALAPFGLSGREDARVRAAGPPARVGPKAALALAMALHELATNAAKYGALSDEGGRVDLAWEPEGERVRVAWRETGGPPVQPPARRGFGSRLIERALAAELDGRVALSFEPGGVVCEMQAPALAGEGEAAFGL